MEKEFMDAIPIAMKSNPDFNERWLQAKIDENPDLLGLGELEVKDKERRQPKAGRLDLLLAEPDGDTRYEVEIQLGPTDESHIIRTIEYWDIERKLYPQYEHVAVIVAEDITSRFLNVVSLFNSVIPLIAIQMRALEVGEYVTLQATTVLDRRFLITEDEDEPGLVTDRNYWLTERGSKKTVEMAEQVVELIREETDLDVNPNYTKFYIGLSKGGFSDNFVMLRPRRSNLLAEFRIPRSEEVTAMIDGSEVATLPYWNRFGGRYRLSLDTGDIKKHETLLRDLITRASSLSAAPA